jgi:hypothetical protein
MRTAHLALHRAIAGHDARLEREDRGQCNCALVKPAHGRPRMRQRKMWATNSPIWGLPGQAAETSPGPEDVERVVTEGAVLASSRGGERERELQQEREKRIPSHCLSAGRQITL